MVIPDLLFQPLEHVLIDDLVGFHHRLDITPVLEKLFPELGSGNTQADSVSVVSDRVYTRDTVVRKGEKMTNLCILVHPGKPGCRYFKEFFPVFVDNIHVTGMYRV